MSLRAIALQPRSTFPQMFLCMYATTNVYELLPYLYMYLCVYVRVYVCMSTTLFRPTLFFPSTVALDEPWEQRRTKEGWCRPRGGENKLISLTQPAVTPPQHDINPKPRLSLFKLYESLCRRIGATSGWLLLLPLASSYLSLLPFVGYKQTYTGERKKSLEFLCGSPPSSAGEDPTNDSFEVTRSTEDNEHRILST